MNNVHLKFMASLLQNEIKPKGKKMDENDIYITWLAYPSIDRDNLSELGWSGGEGRIVAADFLFNICGNCLLDFLISRSCVHPYLQPHIL